MSQQLFHPKYETEEILQSLRETLNSGWTGTGPKCSEIENSWNQFTNAKNSLFLNSATAGLHLALHCLDLPKDSKIITSPITFVSTNAVILYENLIPYFCDINLYHGSLSSAFVIGALKCQDIKAILWVHYGGYISDDYYEVLEFRNKEFPHVPIIEDCAHAAGSFYRDKSRVGSSLTNMSVFSYQAVKNMPTADSGMLCSPFSLQRARQLSWLGIDKSTYERSTTSGEELYKWKYSIPELGWKYNGNDIMAAIALVQLKHLDLDNAYRQKIYRWYKDSLEDRMLIQDDLSSTHLCVVRVGCKRDQVLGALKLNGYAPGVHYLPNYEFAPFNKFEKQDCENASLFAKEVISLPNHLRLTYEDILKISEIVKNNL